MQNEREEPKIHVFDRRFSAHPEEAEQGEEGPRKPTAMEELERQLQERDEQLRATRAQARSSIAELEASHARVQRELAAAAEVPKRRVIGDLLEVVDNLERALEARGDEQGLREGVTLVRDQLLAVLSRYGLRRAESLGQPFDPTRHEAVAVIAVHEPERHDRVIEVLLEGYAIGDDVLRPAQVIVGKLAGEPQPPT